MGKGTDHISNNIRTLRFHRDEMTQKELAEKVGVTRQTIIAIEQGKYAPSLEVAFRIARAFDLNLEDVFSYTPDGESTLNP
ncbi:MAG: helix-turn-helix transcriptional regulator [Chloroflexi bacterium]|nr:helix-turn-helix transcriptional regulator [Chloroflexota bacterium]